MKRAEEIKALVRDLGYVVKSETDFLPTERILRGSWYVDKMIELGIGKVKYMEVEDSYWSSCFIVILEDGRIASGCNIFIQTFIAEVCTDRGLDICDYIYEDGFEAYSDDDSGDDGLIVFTFDWFKRFVDKVKDIKKF